MSQSISASFVWLAMYLPETRSHIGNVKIEFNNPIQWTFTPSNRSQYSPNYPLGTIHSGYVNVVGNNYCLKEHLGAEFGTLGGFSLNGFDPGGKYQIMTPTFGPFDCIYVPVQAFNLNSHLAKGRIMNFQTA